MKRRYRYMLNLFSFGLLLIALYLNFIKKDPTDVPVPSGNNASPVTSSLQPDTKPLLLKQPSQTIVLK